MRTCELCPRLVFAQTNSRFSFNHRSGTLRCWTWRYRRHLEKIAVNRTESDSAMQAYYHNYKPILNQPKHLLKGSATRVDYAMWQYNFVRDLNEVGLVEFEWIRSKDQLADMLGLYNDESLPLKCECGYSDIDGRGCPSERDNIYQGEESVPALSIPLLKSTFTKEKNPSLLFY
jgi:hypothetical protein